MGFQGLTGFGGGATGLSQAGGGLDEFFVANSLRFNDDDSAYLNWTPSGAGSTATWTLSFWIKRGNISSNQYLVAAKDGSNRFELLLNSSDKLAIYNYIGSGAALSATNRVFQDCSAFYHIVYTYDTSQSGNDKLKLYVNGTQETNFSTDNRSSTGASYWNTATVHTIGSSTTPHNPFDGYIADLHFVDGTALDASSFGETVDGSWVPKEFSDSHGTNGYYLKFNNTSDLGEDSAGSNDWTANNLQTVAVNDGTTWSSGAGANFESGNPASNGFNGTGSSYTRTDNANVTATVTLPSSVPFTTLQVRGARDSGNGTITLTGANGAIDVSSQFTSSSATLETVTITGVTSPLSAIALTGISGSAQPRFSQVIVDGNTLIDGQNDAAGIDVLADSPSTYDDGGNGIGNYCTLNPLDKYSGLTLSNGNLNLDHSSGGTIPCCRSTIGMSSGKWYFEVTRGSGTYGTMGICTAATDLSEYAGRSSNAVGGYEIYTGNNKKYAGGSGGTSGYLTENWNSDGDVASCYFDADNGTIGFMVNGTDMGTAYSGIDTTKTYFFECGSEGTELDANFGQRDFVYTPPTGYLALNSYNT